MNQIDRPPIEIPIIKEIRKNFCGPSSIATVLANFSIRTPQVEIAHLAHSNIEDGTSNQGMVDACKAKGLSPLAIENLDLETLDLLLLHRSDTKYPPLAIIDYMDRGIGKIGRWRHKSQEIGRLSDGSIGNVHEDGHYAVYLGRRGDNIWLGCPYRGTYQEYIKNFLDNWYDYDNNNKFNCWAMVVYETEKERDLALKALQEKHPDWNPEDEKILM